MITIISFLTINAAPGDPAAALYGGQIERLRSQDRERINKRLGLDKPAVERYFRWVENVVIKGDMGISYQQGRKVSDILAERLPNTLRLVLCSMFFIIIFAIILGVKAGMNEGSGWDRAVRSISMIFHSIPGFWFAIFCILFFSVHLHILPSSGTESIDKSGDVLDQLKHLILPVFVIVITHVGAFARVIQEKIIEENNSYYALVACSNGMSDTKFTIGILKNALIPFINYVGTSIPGFFGGSIIIENVFSWSGLGQLGLRAAVTKDYPLLMGTILLIGVVVVTSMFIIDIVSLVLNPVLRKQVNL